MSEILLESSSQKKRIFDLGGLVLVCSFLDEQGTFIGYGILHGTIALLWNHKKFL